MSFDVLKIETVKTVDGTKQLVSAKALHDRLGVKRDFSNWVKGRIDSYSFVEGADYFINSPILANEVFIQNPARRKVPETMAATIKARTTT